jgi:hypothetical protein
VFHVHGATFDPSAVRVRTPVHELSAVQIETPVSERNVPRYVAARPSSRATASRSLAAARDTDAYGTAVVASTTTSRPLLRRAVIEQLVSTPRLGPFKSVTRIRTERILRSKRLNAIDSRRAA